MSHMFAAASPTNQPAWIGITVMVVAAIAGLIVTYATRRRPVSPSALGYSRWNWARHHPLQYGGFLFITFVIGAFLVALTHHQSIGAALLIGILFGAGAGAVGAIAGFIIRSAQPSP